MNKTDTHASFVGLVENKRQTNGQSNIQYKMLRGISQGAKKVLSKNPRPGLRDSEESDSQGTIPSCSGKLSEIIQGLGE